MSTFYYFKTSLDYEYFVLVFVHLVGALSIAVWYQMSQIFMLKSFFRQSKKLLILMVWKRPLNTQVRRILFKEVSYQRRIQTLEIILFFLQCCWPLCHHHPLCHQQCAQHLLLYSRCYRFAHVGMFWNLCQQHNVSVFSFLGTTAPNSTNTTLFGSAEQFLDIRDIIKHLSRTMTIFQLIQIFRIKWFCCP